MNLVFLNPLFLFGILAAGIPVVLHLLSRQRSRRIPFSALFLLRRIDVKTAQRHKLVDFLLLFLRTILILLLALALSKPVWRPKGVRVPATGNALRLILLDDSLSSNLSFREKTVFDRGRAFAETAIKTLQPDDSGRLLTTSGGQFPKSPSPARNPAPLLNALEKLKPSYSSRGIFPSLNRILSQAAEKGKSNIEIIIITDMRKRAFDGAADAGRLLKIQPHIYLCPMETPEKTDNLTLWRAAVQTTLPFPGFPLHVEYEIVNHSPEAKETLIRLWDGDNLLEEKKLSLSGSSSLNGAFSFTPLSSDSRTGKIALEPDALPQDNEFYFHWRILERVNILVVSAPGVESLEKDGSLFIAIALDPFERNDMGESLYRVDHIPVDRLESINLEEYSLLFFLNVRGWNEPWVSRIEDYVKSGGAAFFFHGSDFMESGARETPPSLKNVIPFRMELARIERHVEQPDTIGECDADHPIIKSLRNIPRLDFASAHFYKTLNIRIPPEGAAFRVIMKTKNAIPLLIEKNIEKGKVLHFMSGVDPESSDLGAKPFFIPFLFETIKYLLESSGEKYGICGEPIILDYDKPQKDGGDVSYEAIAPDGKKHDLDWEQESLRFTRTDVPGNYRYKPRTGGVNQEGIFSINVDPREGDLTRVTVGEIKEMFPDSLPFTPCHTPAELEKTLKRNRTGKSLSFHLFFAAFIAFALEMIFANLLLAKRERKS